MLSFKTTTKTENYLNFLPMVPDEDKKVFIDIGKRVKSLRESKGLSLRQLAAIADVEHTKIHSLEAGNLNFTFSTLIKIAKGLESQVSDFIKPQ